MAEPELERISAGTLFTADMARAVAFYRALRFPLLYGGGDAEFTSLHVGPGYLNLMKGEPPGCLWGRVILYVSDVDAMHERAVGAGLEPEAAPQDAFWEERYFHIRDPDGNELSFARPLGSGRTA